MRGCEAIIMEMMSRQENHGRFLSYQNRKRTYLQHLRYWHHFLVEHHIGLLLSHNIPHHPCDYILYHLCVLKGLPTLLGSPGDPLRDVLFFHEELEDPAPSLSKRVAELRAHNITIAENELPPHLALYYQSQTAAEYSEKERKPWHHQLPFQQPSWSYSPLRWSFWKRRMVHHRRCREARRMFRFYQDHAVTPDLSRRFIYLPLHMQPECNTCPLAGAYVNQELMVQMLGALVPDDVMIYVKEHPSQELRHPDGMCRSMEFYRDLLSVRNVCFIPPSFSTYTLIGHALAVATASGTAGFEALFRGKSALVFGHRFHREAPGVFPIRTLEDCRQALDTILLGKETPTLFDMRLFLRAVYDESVHGYSDDVKRPATLLSDEENVRNVGKALRTYIHSL